MHRWIWGVLAMLLVAAVAAPAVVVRGAEGGPGARERREPAPQREAGPADMQNRARMLQQRVETLQRTAAMLEQQDMPDLAREVRARAEQSQKELEGLMQAMQHQGGQMRAGAPQPQGPMPDMMQMARHHEEMLGKLMEGQDKLRAQIGELNTKVSALQKEVAGLREQLHR